MTSQATVIEWMNMPGQAVLMMMERVLGFIRRREEGYHHHIIGDRA
jgi:hypothetical protein